jgi:TonB family protein
MGLAATLLIALLAQNMQTETALQSSLKDLTDTFTGIRNQRDTILSTPSRLMRDSHGRTLADDMRQNVLVPSARDEVDALLRAADQSLGAHNLKAANDSLAEAAAMLQREQETYTAIIAYWKWHATARPDRAPYLRYLAINGLQPSYAREIEAAEATFDQQIETRLFVEAMNTTLPQLRQLYEKAAADDAAQVHRVLERKDLVPFKVLDGSAKCAHATGKTSGSSRPMMVSNNPIDDVYPPASRERGEEGVVLVDVLVARNGCPARVWVTASSGYERLDDAALSYALRARYRPAQVRGRVVAERLPLALKFDAR